MTLFPSWSSRALLKKVYGEVELLSNNGVQSWTSKSEISTTVFLLLLLTSDERA